MPKMKPHNPLDRIVLIPIKITTTIQIISSIVVVYAFEKMNTSRNQYLDNTHY